MQRGAARVLEGEEGVYVQQPQHFLRNLVASPFLIPACLLLPGEFWYHPLHISKFLCSSSRAPFIFQVFQLGSPFNGNFRISNGTVGDLVRDRGPWFQVGRHSVYLLPGPIMTAARRHVATESLHLRRKCANEDGSTTHPRSPYPDKGKPFTGSDGARHLQGSLVPHSFRTSLSLFTLCFFLSPSAT